MVSKDDIKKLSGLARIDIGEKEAEKLAGEIGDILGYVGQVSEVAKGSKNIDSIVVGAVTNVLREDNDPTLSGTYSKDLIEEFPEKQGGYLKVKKIL